VSSSTGKLDDRYLVERACGGDASAFGSLVELYSSKVFNLVAYMCGDSELAEDLVQEIFLKAFKGIRNFRADSGFYTWLYRIAANSVLSQRRDDERARSKMDVLRKDEALRGHQSNGDPVAALDRQERQQVVRNAIQQLSHQESAVVVLRDMEGLSYQEISSALQVPVGTVRSRLFRARMALRDVLKGILGELQ